MPFFDMVKKDAYYFKHHTTSGRTIKMRTLAHIYGHWGKGVYWDVVEMLRDQDGYRLECDDSSLSLLADLIGAKDATKFISWFNDCVRIDLLRKEGKFFISPGLNDCMIEWDTKKSNGAKGGRPPKLTETAENDNQPHNQSHNQDHNLTDNQNTNLTITDHITSTEEYSTTHSSTLDGFDRFWGSYPKKKSKGDAERAWKKLKPSLELQIKIQLSIASLKATNDWKRDNGQFIPYPSKWLNAKGWNDDTSTPQDTNTMIYHDSN